MNKKQLKRLRKKKKLQKRENVMKNNRPKVTDISCYDGGFVLKGKPEHIRIVIDPLEEYERV